MSTLEGYLREDLDPKAGTPSKGYLRLFAGNKVRLRYSYVVECTGCDMDENGNVIAVHCNYFADSKSGTDGSAKGTP